MEHYRTLATAATMIAAIATTTSAQTFEPTFHVGGALHTYAVAQQNGFGQAGEVTDASKWGVGASVARARIMTEANLTTKDYLFIETELTGEMGLAADKKASVRILDAQYNHTFCDEFVVSAGKILVSHNRNGLQGVATLMANDFSYFQYAYNMTKDSPLQNDAGRDVGVNLSGAFREGHLHYWLGAFSGRRTFEGQTTAPLRYIGRVQYNLFDADKYAGTNLGEGKTVSFAVGFDTQGTYVAAGADVFVDYPMGDAGSVTLNCAYSYTTGGDDAQKKYSFATMIPEQDIWFAELGYYFKESKLQPWVKYEHQNLHNYLASTKVFGGGLNYFFNGYNTNLKLSYVGMQKGVTSETGSVDVKTYGQFQFQLQLCLF